MGVTRDGRVIHIVGAAAVEEAEVLAALLAAEPGATVDWSQAGPLHTAVVQVLLVLRPAMRGRPADPFAERWLAPLLPGAVE